MQRLVNYRLVLILALGLLCAGLLLNGHLVPGGDNATYMVLGQSLATMRGYRMISDPRQPAMALYPPGYPSLVAGMLLLMRNAEQLLAAILPLKVVSIGFFLGAITVAYGLFRQRDANLAVLTALLMAVNPALLHFANEVGTETPYLFLSLGCIWLFERYSQKPRTAALWSTAALLVVTFYVRTIALVLLVALVGHLVRQRKTKQALLLLLVVVAFTAPWFVYTSSLPSTGTSVGLGRGYFALYFSSDPYGSERASVQDWLVRILQNLRVYGLEIWPDVLFPHASRMAALLGPVGSLLLTTMFVLVAVGFVLEARRGSAAEWYVALFYASCIGYLWAQSRLIVPVVPFALFYFVRAIDHVASFLARERPRLRVPLLSLVSLLLAWSSTVATARGIRHNLRHGLGNSVDAYYAEDAEWSNYLEAVRWIAAQSGEESAVMCRKADLLYVLTAHQALEYPYSMEGVELMRAVYDSRAAFVVEDAFTWTRTTQQYLRPALQDWQAEDPLALALAYETSAPHTRVWRVTYSD